MKGKLRYREMWGVEWCDDHGRLNFLPLFNSREYKVNEINSGVEVDFKVVTYCKIHKTTTNVGPCTLDCAWDTVSYAQLTNEVPCQHTYSKEFIQPHPRRCLDCGAAEEIKPFQPPMPSKSIHDMIKVFTTNAHPDKAGDILTKKFEDWVNSLDELETLEVISFQSNTATSAAQYANHYSTMLTVQYKIK